MKTQLLFLLLSTLFSLKTTAQDVQTRSLPFFNKISYEGYGSIFLEPSDDPAIKVQSSADYSSEHIRTEVRDETLYVWYDFKTANNAPFDHQRIDVYLYYPALTHLELKGKIRVDGIQPVSSEDFSITATGNIDLRLPVEVDHLTAKFTGEINAALTGKVNHEDINFTGRGSLNILELHAQTAQIHTDGKAQVYLPYIASMQAMAAGMSEIVYRNNPAYRVSKAIPNSTTKYDRYSFPLANLTFFPNHCKCPEISLNL